MKNSIKDSNLKATQMKIDWREFGSVLISGGVGGFLSWLYTITVGKPIALAWYVAIPASILLGVGAAFIGVYVIANSDTRALLRCLGFALLCGFTWKPVYDAGSALIDQSIQQREERKVMSLYLEKSEELAKELHAISIDQLPSKISEATWSTVQAVQALHQIKSNQIRNEMIDSTIEIIDAIEAVAPKRPHEVFMSLKELGERSATSGETKIANLVITSLSTLSRDPFMQHQEIRMEASQYIKEISSLVLRDYKINILYDKDNADSDKVAKNIESIIRTKNLTTWITIAPRTQDFFKSLDMPNGNLVRCTPGKDLEAARALVEVLKLADSSLSFHLKSIDINSPGTLYVYIWMEKG